MPNPLFILKNKSELEKYLQRDTIYGAAWAIGFFAISGYLLGLAIKPLKQYLVYKKSLK